MLGLGRCSMSPTRSTPPWMVVTLLGLRFSVSWRGMECLKERTGYVDYRRDSYPIPVVYTHLQIDWTLNGANDMPTFSTGRLPDTGASLCPWGLGSEIRHGSGLRIRAPRRTSSHTLTCATLVPGYRFCVLVSVFLHTSGRATWLGVRKLTSTL